MSLLGSIQLANNALLANQLGIQVTGNNIANANTPGYLRQEIVFTPAPTQRKGDLLLGLGVDVSAVIQKTDKFLEERLRAAISDLSNGEAQEGTYAQLETLLGELSDTDLSSTLSKFFGSISDVLNQPESTPVRNLAVQQGRALADDIRKFDKEVRNLRVDVNNRIADTGIDINRLTKRIADLNKQIAVAEGGAISKSDAVGLRDQRGIALEELSKIIDIKAVEQASGSVTVFAGGEYLVFEATSREVATVINSDRGLNCYDIRLKETDAPLNISSGKLTGLIASRDTVLGGFLDQLDSFTKTFMFEFNKLHSSGQGLTGNELLTSEATITDTSAALDHAGLTFTPVNGSFQVQLYDKQTKLTKTFDIGVKLNGLDGDTSLASLASDLDAIDGLKAVITPTGKLQLTTETNGVSFAFANDTSGTLAALGIGTFFSGNGALDIGVSETIRKDPAKLATSSGGIGKDTNNGVLLAGMMDRALESQNGATLSDMYDIMAGEVTQQAAISHAVVDGFRDFQQTLDGQRLAVSGVNIDQETVNLISYQRSFQASARFIATVNELLEILVTL